MPTIHLALDESGDFNFTPTGSRFYIFTIAWTYNPAPLAEGLTRLRHSLLKQGKDIPSFHAAEDEQATRNKVVELLCSHADWRWAAIVLEKRKINPALYDPYLFYPQFASMLFRFVFRGCLAAGTSHVMAFTDQLPLKSKREPVEKAFKKTCRAELGKTPFHVYHHPRASNPWIQAVDYCCWSVYRKWQGGDSRTYDTLKCRLQAPELDLCSRGDQTAYY